MKITIGLRRALWVFLNLALVGCVLCLTAVLRRTLEEAHRLQSAMQIQGTQLAQNASEWADAEEEKITQNLLIAKLREEIRSLKGKSAPASDSQPGDDTSVRDNLFQGFAYQPSVQDIPVLSPAEMDDLRRRRDRMPQRIGDAALRNNDINALLRDAKWNPSGKELGAEEQLQLAIALKDYRFYCVFSPLERLHKTILPLVAAMRSRGEYITYPSDEGPPALEGVGITHAEPADDRAYRRLYLFGARDYPDLHHDQTVERQRALETFVRVYELLNGLAEETSQ